MTEVWNSGAAGGPCHLSYQFLAARGVTHECVRQPQCVVCVILTARGMDPTSLVGAPQNLQQLLQRVQHKPGGHGGKEVGGHRGAVGLLDTGSHGSVSSEPLQGTHSSSGPATGWEEDERVCPLVLPLLVRTALDGPGKRPGKGLLLGKEPRWGGLRVNSVMAQLQERFGAMRGF